MTEACGERVNETAAVTPARPGLDIAAETLRQIAGELTAAAGEARHRPGRQHQAWSLTCSKDTAGTISAD